MQHAQDLVLAIIDAHQRALPAADLFAIAQRFLDACAAAERERAAHALADIPPPLGSYDFYRGYHRALADSIAIIRALE